ncbi:hypothetical protein G9444_0780 [Rhodococcus erythropolis]|uniref:Uncharacterized protein n=1 Tax=Rhodococcus erythropolis TaxID=1833 RepID=A0A6G9CM81_RHOER|nr:hypothetical protein [Rhodococcus erythropolis]QIP38024.1 hypothetical protein G9444_0780 [Rhodococcus erythropolis]
MRHICVHGAYDRASRSAQRMAVLDPAPDAAAEATLTDAEQLVVDRSDPDAVAN